jgi:hypothetical protein
MEEVIQKIKELGLPENESNEIFEMLSEEVLQVIFEQLAEQSTDEELTVIENRIKESKSTEHFENIINEIAITVFGDDAQEEIKNIYLDLFEQFKTTVDEAKALIERANNGDPQAQELLSKAQETEDFKQIMNDQQPT